MRHRAIVLAALLVVTATAAGGAGGVAATGADAAAATQANCEYPITESDATGEEVTVESAPERVIVLGPSAAQTAWEIGAGDRVVGIDAFSTYLDGAENVSVVSQGREAVQYEQALEQEPDLVIVAGDSYSDAVSDQFRDANVTTFKLPNAGSLEDIYDNTQIVGSLTGECDGAGATVAEMQDQVGVVAETVERADDRPTIYYPLGSGYTVGPGSFIDAVIERAGAENIVGEEFSAYPQVTGEFVVEEDPEWLLATYSPSLGQNASDPAALLPRSDAINQTQAYQNGNVIAVDANHLNQPAPRVVDSMTRIARQLHPEAFAAANATTTTAATTRTTTAETTEATTAETTVAETTTQTTETTESDGLPGFGPAVAVAALAVAGLGLFRRRA